MLFRLRLSLVMIEFIQCMQFHLYMYLSNLIQVHSYAAENSSLNVFRYAEAGEVAKKVHLQHYSIENTISCKSKMQFIPKDPDMS